MNRFVKKNFVLLAALIGSGAVSLGLVIAALIVSFELLTSMNETQEVRNKVNKLNKSTPVPGAINASRIQHDIDIYQKSVSDLKKMFRFPLDPAVEAFISTLAAPNPKRLTQEQIDRFRIRDPKEDEMDEEQIKKLPLKMRKLTLDEFKELFRERFENEHGNNSDAEKESLATQTFFINGFRRIFPNWQQSIRAFTAKASTITDEPIGPTNAVPLLLYGMGFQRVTPDFNEFVRLMESYRNVIEHKAEKSKLELMGNASSFMMGDSKENKSSLDGLSNIVPADMREILFQWDIYGVIIKHLGDAKIKMLHNIKIRDFAEAPEEGRRFGTLSENIGSYKLVHYTMEITANMESIQDFCRRLDLDFRNNRTFIVRAVTLYPEENGAAILMKQDSPVQTSNETDDSAGSGRGRRRRARVEQPVADQENKVDPEEAQRQRELAEAKLPVHQRTGYGAVLVGSGDLCRAFIDVDYVTIERNQ